jgi:hypothetical protein
MEPTNWIDSRYVSICIRPRATIREIVDRDPNDRVIALVLTAAIVGALTNAIYNYNYNPTAFTIANKPIPVMSPQASQLMSFWVVLAWPLLAVPFLYINGALLRWTGSLLGGTAKAVEVRAAIAWSSVLTIIVSLAGFAIRFLAPVPSQPPVAQAMSAVLAYWRSILPYLIISAPLWLWWWTVSFKCLGEVHRFSAWRALGSSLIGILVLGGALLIALIVLGIVQAVALELTDDALVRALWMSFAVGVLIVLVGGAWFWRYSRSRAES